MLRCCCSVARACRRLEQAGQRLCIAAERAAAVLGEPLRPRREVALDLGRRAEKGAAQEQPGHAPRMAQQIGERDAGAPRAGGDGPAFDADLLAQALDVGDERVERVVPRLARRLAAPAAALVEGDPAQRQAAPGGERLGARLAAGAAMQQQQGQAVGVAALPPGDAMPFGRLEPGVLA